MLQISPQSDYRVLLKAKSRGFKASALEKTLLCRCVRGADREADCAI